MGDNITILDTDKYEVKANTFSWDMYITTDEGTSNIDCDIILYDTDNDFILEYNTKEFKGFIVLNNLGILGLYLNVVKVDTKSTNLVDHMGAYDLDRFKPHDDTTGFKYNIGTKEFTITSNTSGDIVFKLEDLEKIETGGRS